MTRSGNNGSHTSTAVPPLLPILKHLKLLCSSFASLDCLLQLATSKGLTGLVLCCTRVRLAPGVQQLPNLKVLDLSLQLADASGCLQSS